MTEPDREPVAQRLSAREGGTVTSLASTADGLRLGHRVLPAR